jgi:hypothetical protein
MELVLSRCVSLLEEEKSGEEKSKRENMSTKGFFLFFYSCVCICVCVCPRYTLLPKALVGIVHQALQLRINIFSFSLLLMALFFLPRTDQQQKFQIVGVWVGRLGLSGQWPPRSC